MEVAAPAGVDPTWLFRELPSRVLLCVAADQVAEVHRRHVAAGVPARLVGRVEGDRLMVTADGAPLVDLAAADVVARWKGALPEQLASGTTQG